MSTKGSSFERWLCEQLSLWWTNGERTDVFWRTAGSGARATVRGKQNKATANQHGDVCAIDPIGQPLIDAVTWELKRGYSSDTIADLLDKPKGAAEQRWEKWIAKAEKSSESAGSHSWVIVAKRDRREPLIFIPTQFSASLIAYNCLLSHCSPYLTFRMDLLTGIVSTPLENFFKIVKPEAIKEMDKLKRI